MSDHKSKKASKPASKGKPRARPPVQTRAQTSARTSARVAPGMPRQDPKAVEAEKLNEKKRLFLTAYIACMKHLPALEKAKLTYREVSRWIAPNMPDYDPEFTKLYNEAKQVNDQWRHIQALEEIDRRAIEGWDEEVYYKGVLCGTIHRYSDHLLAAKLRAVDPRYSTTRTEVTGPDGGPVQVAAITWSPPPVKSVKEWEEQYSHMVKAKRKETHKGP